MERETPRTWAFVRSTAESGGKGALLARSIHTTGNPSASHAVPRPFRSPLTPYPSPISNHPYCYRRFGCSRDRCRLAVRVLSRFLAPPKIPIGPRASFAVSVFEARCPASFRSRPTLYSSFRGLYSLSRGKERGRGFIYSTRIDQGWVSVWMKRSLRFSRLCGSFHELKECRNIGRG